MYNTISGRFGDEEFQGRKTRALRAHTPRAPCICIVVLLMTFIYMYIVHVHMSRKHNVMHKCIYSPTLIIRTPLASSKIQAFE